LRFSYATGFKEPRLEETFAGPPYSVPNPGLKPERVRAFEAGIQQDFLHGKYVFNATYFNNLFHDQINYETVNPTTFVGEYFNVNQAFAQGAEVELQARLRSRLLLNTAYTYTSTEILSDPAPIDSQYNPGQPLLRRPKHSATTLLSYLGSRWGANLSGSFVGRRPDDDFDGFNILPRRRLRSRRSRRMVHHQLPHHRLCQYRERSRPPLQTRSSAIPRSPSTSAPDFASASEANKSEGLNAVSNQNDVETAAFGCPAKRSEAEPANRRNPNLL